MVPGESISQVVVEDVKLIAAQPLWRGRLKDGFNGTRSNQENRRLNKIEGEIMMALSKR